jgi:hypothetical protein
MHIDFLFGQGWRRNIVMDGSPHLPADIRQWNGEVRPVTCVTAEVIVPMELLVGER